MTTVTLLFFSISFVKAVKTIPSHFSPTEIDLSLENQKVVRELTFPQSKYWTKYSKLLYIDYTDTFCEENKGKIFPDTSKRNEYYLCQNGRKELYQCIEGFEFDPTKLRCIQSIINSNRNSTLYDCFRQTDGFYPDYSKDCQDYFRCINGVQVERFSCPPNLSFDYLLQTCQKESEVSCVKPNCQLGSDGFYTHPGSKCQAYYYCQGGIRSDIQCPRGTIFDAKVGSCVENGICYEPVCAGRVDGYYPDTTQDCRRFFECKGGVLKKVISCPFGQRHNGYACVPPPFYNCEKPEKTAAAFYYGPNDECKQLQDTVYIIPKTDCRNVRVCLRGKTSATFECPRDQRFNGNYCVSKDLVPCDDACSMKSDGFYADEFSDCRDYFSCFNNKISKRKRCPNGTAFNGFICIPDYLVSCPKKSVLVTDKCLGLRDGLHPDYLNGCRNYFYCYNYHMVSMGSCLPGMIWNGKYCTEKKDIICEGPKKLKECNGLLPGLYQNRTSGCTKYFYCNNGSGTTLSCPLGLIFNGEKCVSADEYTCLRSDDCINQPDGYRQDESTGCRSYYYCSNGNKITYICPEGFLFNGSYCVPTYSYRCPFDSSRDCLGKTDGYHPDKSSECKKYFYCQKEEKLTTLTCEGKKIFTGQGCILTTDPKSQCLQVLSNPCQNKKDGIYPDIKTECKKYYRCLKKTLLDENWCPKGFGFNGSMCIKNYSCSQKADNPVCEPDQNGFFQDLASNCRNYYFCLGRTKIVGTCPGNTLFNGYFCIDSNYYICPVEKS